MRHVSVRTLLVLALVFFWCSMSLAAEGKPPAGESKAPAGVPAPAKKVEPPPPPPPPEYLTMKLTGLNDGQNFTLKEILRKEKNLLVFFQTSCGACRGELRFLTDEYFGNPKVGIIGISVDSDKEYMKGKISAENYKFDEVISDPGFDFAGKFGVSFTPATIVMSQKGDIIKTINGYKTTTKKEFFELLK